MKKTRKLIPALAMLLVSAVMMSTASFAWFAMNKQVTATGLNIKAVSNSVWLVINTGDTFDSNGDEITASTAATTKELSPVAYKPTVEVTSTNVTRADSWHYAHSDDKASPTAVALSYKDCTDLEGYVASEKFAIGLNAANSPALSASNLKLTAVNLPEGTGISVIVVCGTNAYLHTADATGLTETLAATVTTAGTVVTVYYFINGEDIAVYEDNISALTGSVTLTFDID